MREDPHAWFLLHAAKHYNIKVTVDTDPLLHAYYGRSIFFDLEYVQL